ncbi:hypothetical protein [Muriicola sp. Z0-33]|uniref:hypothetical protein n=1 Tax=Muriicola sp. Z0-33 TaxID=2816957 RepID=UPI00223755D2|nr:hypothetical protein [Muriicola sp. Z0-33]MCW5515172.1 hypothetical protein [Muriicola sp. Z0-33]
MNVHDFTYLLQHPDKVVDPVQTNQLEDILEEYPYFQAARAMHLKGLKNLNSFKYNNALKVTAAYTSDRDILFDFITSSEFLQNTIADNISGKNPLADQQIISEEVTPLDTADISMIEDSEDEPLPRSAKDAEDILDPALFKSKDPEIDKSIAREKKQLEEELEIGAPLTFTKKEKYSFGEWLQLTSLKKVERSQEKEAVDEDSNEVQVDFTLEEDPLKKKKFDLIDKFIASNPKIKPAESTSEKIDIEKSLKFDKKELMTETLAKVYLEQKKYKKAIQAYTILSLKYPEKSGFFADRIKAVKKLQQEN